jgi:AcrR family transcriptional regulator
VPNRATELRWAYDGRKEGLSRELVVAAAVRLADREGISAVSIRRVAGELEVRPMSLYSYFASKDDLIALMLDRVNGTLLLDDPLPSDWREALRAIARCAWEAYLEHPWMLQVFGAGARVGPNQLRRAEQSATAVATLGVDPATAWNALQIVHEWTIGHALHTVTLREDSQLQAHLAEADPIEFPRMAAVYADRQRADPDHSFDLGIDTVLDGIERRLLAVRAP